MRHGVGLSRDAAKVVSKRRPEQSAMSSPGSKELKADDDDVFHVIKRPRAPLTTNGMNSSL